MRPDRAAVTWLTAALVDGSDRVALCYGWIDGQKRIEQFVRMLEKGEKLYP